MKVAILPSDKSTYSRAQKLAQQLKLPLVTTVNENFQIYCVVNTDHLAIHFHENKKPFIVSIDFLKGPLAYRRVHGGGIQQLLARAVGVKGNDKPSVIDATAGLGKDAFILASLGCRVTLVERSPIIAALVEDALMRLQASRGNISLHLIVADASSYLQHTTAPDVIYCDPMFPTRTKSALVKKEMRLLRMIVGEDSDAPQLLKIALKVAKKRVVVKRPRLAAALAGIKPSFSLVGKTSRFDVYQCESFACCASKIDQNML